MDHPIHGNAQTPYWYTAGNSSGRLTEPDTAAYMHHVHSRRSRQISMVIDHENYLFCRIPDLCTELLIHQSADSSLVDYIRNLNVQRNINPIMMYDPDAALCRTQVPQISYVPPEFRKIVREILSFIVYLHSKNYSLSVPREANLSLQMNFLVAGDVVKFWRVEFKDADDETKLRDYRLIYDVVEQLFDGRPEPLPRDYQDLSVCLWELSEALPVREASILEHLALLSHDQRIARVRAYHEIGKMLVEPYIGDYDAAILATRDHFWNWSWTWDFINNQEFIPARDCCAYPFRKDYPDQKLEEIPYNAIANYYGDYDGNNRIARDYLRFSRNLAAHLAGYFGQIPLEFPLRLTATDEDIDCIIMHCCGDGLLHFHRHLTDRLISFIARSER